MKMHPWWYMAYIALILHVNCVPMIIIAISACTHIIHPACILHIKDSVCIELLGVLCTLPNFKNIGGARAPLAPPFLLLCLRILEVAFNNCLRCIWSLPLQTHIGILHSCADLQSVYNTIHSVFVLRKFSIELVPVHMKLTCACCVL